MDNKKFLQESEYEFPYHYIPRFNENNYSQVINMVWGYTYLARIEKIIEILKGVRFSSLLDVGCGDGRLLFELQKCFPEKNLFGSDYSQSAIKFAELFNPLIKFLKIDFTEDIKVVDEFDVLTIIEVIEHIQPDQVPIFIGNSMRLLRKGGKLILSVPSTNIKTTPKHYQHFDIKKLETLLSPYITFDEVYYVQRLNSLFDNFIIHLLGNRFFALTDKAFLNWVYTYFSKRRYIGTEFDSMDIIVVGTRQ